MMFTPYVERNANKTYSEWFLRPTDGTHTQHAIALRKLGKKPAPNRRLNWHRADTAAEVHALRLRNEAWVLWMCLERERTHLPFGYPRYSDERLDRVIVRAKLRYERRYANWQRVSGQANAKVPVDARKVAG